MLIKRGDDDYEVSEFNPFQVADDVGNNGGYSRDNIYYRVIGQFQ
jgi:hypothetical protein